MLTINQADLFYAAEYALAALLLLLCTWQRGTLDIRRQIGRKVFFRRLLLVLFVSVLGIALMTGIYFIRLEPEVRFAAVGAVQFFMTVCNSVILGSSFFQRYRVYPRGSALAAVFILMYGVSDFFMPREFIIVTRDDLVKAISHNSLVAGPARKASAAIVIVGKKENISFPEEWSFDCAAAAENILIEAEHLGLGSIWLQVYPYADRKAHLLNILDIPAEMEPFCIIAIGYAERKPVRMNRYNERIIYNDLYGSRKK